MMISPSNLEASHTVSYHTATNINRFLHRVDRITERLGLNVPQIVDLAQLRCLPTATLGRALADFLDQHQLTPFTTGARRKQLHDSIHVLTGYGTDPMGEAEVQAFLLGSRFRLTHVLLGLGLIRIIYRQSAQSPDRVGKRLIAAYLRGRASSFDLEDWYPETQWHLPLSDVQRRFKIFVHVNFLLRNQT